MRGVSLRNFYDGMIMLASFDSIRKVHLIKDWGVDYKELQEVRIVLPKKRRRRESGPFMTCAGMSMLNQI